MVDFGRISTIKPICNPWAGTVNPSSGTTGFQASLEQPVVASAGSLPAPEGCKDICMA